MSAQVSYKKQFLLFIMLLITLLVVVELFVNVWLYYFYRCNFEENEMFQDIDENVKREICLDNIGVDIMKQNMTYVRHTVKTASGFYVDPVYINGDRFRGPDFSPEKPENTFRIFTVGGSTTFGAGVFNNQTWPFYLQELYDKTNLGFNVEVINVGKAKWGAIQETNLIKEHLLNFEPDYFIVYDGWNDIDGWLMKGEGGKSPTEWRENWMEICDLGKQMGYKTTITLQPIIFTTKKIMTEQEIENYNYALRGLKPEKYPLYFEQLEILDSHCSGTADLRNIFDNLHEPIYYDRVHVGPSGNKIVAENIYQLSLPIVQDKIKEKFSNGDLEAFSNEKIIIPSLDNSDSFLDESYIVKNIISQYNTPRISTIIFEPSFLILEPTDVFMFITLFIGALFFIYEAFHSKKGSGHSTAFVLLMSIGLICAGYAFAILFGIYEPIVSEGIIQFILDAILVALVIILGAGAVYKIVQSLRMITFYY